MPAVPEDHAAKSVAHPRHQRRRGIALLLSITIACLTAFVGLAGPAYAAGATVSITPSSTSTQSGIAATFTLTITCSNAGGCANTTVSFPTTALTGDGTTTDFGAWVGNSSCGAVTKTVTPGLVTFTYGTVPNGALSCTFPVTPPEYTTFNGAKATITPTVAGSNFTSATGAPATLTAIAGHNDKITKSPSQQGVAGGGQLFWRVTFDCGQHVGGPNTGDIGLSSLTITDQLPAGFTYASLVQQPSGTPPFATASYDPATRTFTYSDPTGNTCNDPQWGSTPSGGPGGNAIVLDLHGTATTDGTTPTPNGTNLTNTVNSSFTYLDGTPGTSSATAGPIPVTAPVAPGYLAKLAFSSTMYNGGQYSVGSFKGESATTPGPITQYTYAGSWDGTGNTAQYYLNMSPVGPNAGVDFSVQDPMPCLSNGSGSVYSSLPPGPPYCANPGFVPTLIVPRAGFTASTSDKITVVFNDGTTTDVSYVAGVGWTIPTTKPVAELDIKPFPEEGQNTGTVQFMIQGYAAAGTQALAPLVLTNTASSSAYLVSSGAQLQTDKRSDNLIVEPVASQTIVDPVINASYSGSCQENVKWFGPGATNQVEVTSAPSQKIVIDYLAPANSQVTAASLTQTFTLTQVHSSIGYTPGIISPQPAPGEPYTSGAITATTSTDPATQRTLYEWTIPAGTIKTPGNYTVLGSALTVQLPAGCAGTYDNDLTVGYGGPVTACIDASIQDRINTNSRSLAAPSVPNDPSADSDLHSNGIGTSNYCGISSPIKVAAINPAYRVDKSVQGNLDAAPVAGGGIGHVSPTGGTATYTLSFANTGQSNLDNPVLYDILPRVGDTEASSTDPRNSKFPVTLTGVGPVPPGVTVYYSQATNPCRPEVLATNPGCVNDWTSTAPASLVSVTALKIVYDGTVFVGASTAGIHGFSVPYTVATPTTSVGNTAWNSVGTSVLAGTSPMPPAESDYTGLAAQASQPQVTKTASTSTYGKVGDTITYTFTVTNNTAVTLSPVTVTDKLTDAAAGDAAPTVTCQSLATPAGTCSGTSTSLAPNQVATFSATYTVNQADLDHGLITDQATATAQPPTGGVLVNSSSPVTVTAVQSPALSMVKSALPTAVSAVGDQVTYSFLVTNTGNVTVGNVGVQDSVFSGSGTLSTPSCPNGSLAPGAQETCTATYGVTQADLNAGSITNTAHASGVGAGGQAVSSSDSSATVSVTQSPGLSLVKSADPSSAAAYTAGQVITYHYVVTNTGNVSVTGVGITEGTFTGSGSLSAISCPASTLAPKAQVDCTATYTLTQSDIDAGSISNTATAHGTGPGGGVSSAPSTVATPATPNPGLSLTKTALPTTMSKAGDQVTYSFLVANTGNVTISGVGIDESAFTGTGTSPAPVCSPTTLAPGQQVTCQATYAVTQADLDAGTVTNTATATGTAPGGAGVSSKPSSATVTSTATASVSLVKTSDPAGPAAFTAGQQVTYHYLVTNTGTLTVTGVGIAEGTFTGSGSLANLSCPTSTLPPNGQVDCTATYALTQADVDAGSVSNTATATGTSSTGLVASSPSTVVTFVTANPAMTLTKSALPTTVSKAGDTVTYSFLVANTGNVTLSGLAIAEQDFTGTGTLGTPTCPTTTLAPGDQITCTATYAVTQADINAGSITNTAQASSLTPDQTQVQSNPSSASVSADQTPALSLVKSADPAGPATFTAGQQLTYHYLVTNTGNVTLTGVGIAEGTFTGSGTLSGISCPTTTLAPADHVDCTATYTLTQADIDAGSVANTATATGTAPGNTAVSSAPSTVTTPETPNPELTLAKSVLPTTVSAAGDEVSYSYLVTNTGNVTIHSVAIEETDFSGTGTPPAPSCPSTTLAPGEQVTCTATYTVTQADIDAGTVTNTADATGTAPNSDAVTSNSSKATVTANQSPELLLSKSATPATAGAVGDEVTYTFAVQNTGNVTLTHVAIAEAAFSGSGTLSTIACPSTTLAPGDGVDCTATYAVTQADLDAGSVTNTANASAQDPAGAPVTSPASSATVSIKTGPALKLVKTVTPTTVTKSGQQVTYHFAITNTGNVTVRALAVKETSFTGSGPLSAISCPTTTLAPNQHATCTAHYTVTSKDLTAAQISNTAVATGTAGPNARAVAVRSGASTARLAVHAAAHQASGGSGSSGGGVAETGVRVMNLIADALGVLLIGALILITARRRRA